MYRQPAAENENQLAVHVLPSQLIVPVAVAMIMLFCDGHCCNECNRKGRSVWIGKANRWEVLKGNELESYDAKWATAVFNESNET